MVFAVRDLMQDSYPDLKTNAERISKIVASEESRFARTLDLGLKKLRGAHQGLSRRVRRRSRQFLFSQPWLNQDELKQHIRKVIERGGGSIYLELQKLFGEKVGDSLAAEILEKVGRPFLPGHLAFTLYDTFGMPLDFMEEAAGSRCCVRQRRLQ